MISKKRKSDLEDFKYLIDSRNLSEKQKKSNAVEILKARHERLKERSDSDIVLAKLMQLKFQMNAYVNDVKKSKGHSFSYFLATYIDTVYDKRKNFAQDMSITPLVLSQVLNNHRDPQQDFMLRLIIHSERFFNQVGGVDYAIWFHVFYKEKLDKILSQKGWKSSAKKFVSYSNLLLVNK